MENVLQQAEFVIFTDQKALIHLNEQRLRTVWQQKVFTKLLGLHYKIVYKTRVENGVADALCRRAHPPSQCFSMSSCTPQWFDEVVAGYSSDVSAQDMITKLSLDPESVPHFQLCNGILKYKNKIWLGVNNALQQKVIAALHCAPFGGGGILVFKLH